MERIGARVGNDRFGHTVEELAEVDAPVIYDVRKKSEFDSERAIAAVNLPLDYWWEQPEKDAF